MQEELKIVISAVSKGVNEAFKKTGSSMADSLKKGRLAMNAFNKTAKSGHKVVGALKSQMGQLIGAFAGFQALKSATNIIKDADQAVFNMASSVQAASREFKNLGSVKDWEISIHNLSKELKIYSDTALKNAVSRTVDMTKRLGLSKIQMEEVIKRSADLGAGKTDLNGAIERVTAALRGEAEASEYLGLTLNENFIKTWYEARGAMQGAWKDLNDLQKAQIRYSVFLDQSNEMQGRAAASAKTFGGALKLIGKEINNAIVNNQDMTGAMNDLSDTFRANAGDIGEALSELIGILAKAIELAVKYKDVILAMGVAFLSLAVIKKVTLYVQGLNAAFVVMTGMGILAWISDLRVGLNAVALQAGAAGMALKFALAGAAAYGAIQIGLLVKEIWQWRKAQIAARESQDRLIANSDRMIERFKKFKDAKLPDDITGSAPEDLKRLNDELVKARVYWTAMKGKMAEIGDSKGLRDADVRLSEINSHLIKIKNTGAFEEVEKVATASADAIKEFETAAKKAYETAKKKAEEYGRKVIEWENKIKYARLSTQDKIRELGRKGMDEETVWMDKKLQAEEKLAAARAAFKKKDYQLAEKLAKDSEALYAGLATEVKSGEGKDSVVVQAIEQTKEIAIAGVKEVGGFIESVYSEQKNSATAMEKEFSARAAKIKESLDELSKTRTAKVEVELENLNEAKASLENWLKQPATKIVKIKTVEAKSSGGPAGMAAGGRLPGYGGGDRISALLEAGEFIIRKEAVRKYGAGLFAALNNFRLPAIPSVPRFAYATGGPVSGMGIRDLGRVEIAVGGRGYPVMGEVDVIEKLKTALKREKLLRSN